MHEYCYIVASSCLLHANTSIMCMLIHLIIWLQSFQQMCPTNFPHFQHSHLHPPKFHNSYKVPWWDFCASTAIICWVSEFVNFFLGRGGGRINQPMWILEGRQPSEAAGGGFGEGFSRHQVFVFLFLGACRPVTVVQVVDVLNFVGCQTAKRQPPKDWHPGIPYECWGMPKPMDRILKITSRQLYPCQMNGVEHPMSKLFKRNLIRTKLFWRVILLGYFFR